MKTLFAVVAWLIVLGGSATCFGAAAVFLNNYDVNGGNGNPIHYIVALNDAEWVTLQSGFADAGCYVEILGGADASNLAPLKSTGQGNPSVFALHAGMFDAGIGNLPGLADNAIATFQAIAWKGTGGVDDWKNTAAVAWSVTWTQATGANTPPNLPSPATLQFAPGVTIIEYVVPEPSTFALGILGIIIWLGFARIHD